MATSAKLKGHGASVLCLDLSSASSSPLLLSGSEDGTARVWDLRDNTRRTALCIRVPSGGDVLSAVFAPPMTTSRETTSFGHDCSVFLGVENSVLEYDLRHAESPIVVSEPTQNWSGILQNQDEVNQIGLAYYNNKTTTTDSKKKNKKKGGTKKRRQQQSSSDEAGSLYIAACDDAGKVRWTESSTNASTILHHDGNGVAVVPSCAFRPIDNKNSKTLELASGGSDCKIHLWDIFRPKKPISTFLVTPPNEGDHSKPQVCNPPYVYSLAWSKNGKSLAAGLGDGTVGVFEINNRTLVQNQLLVGSESADGTMQYAHDSSVASVVYPSFSVSTGGRILCSAGGSGSIVFWDLGKQQSWNDIDETSTNHNDDGVANLFPPTLLKELRSGNAGFDSASPNKPRILFDIAHDQKINWITRAAPSCDPSSEYNDTIFVADTSPEITAYTIPFGT